MYKSREVKKFMQLLDWDTDIRQLFRHGWKWSRIFPGGTLRPKQIRFVGEEKILQRLPANPPAEDFFKLYITEEMIDYLVVQTNLYARQFLEREKDNLKPHSRVHEWKLNRQGWNADILSYTITDGYCAQTKTYMYWSTDSILATPIFNHVMRRNRFLLLLFRFFHFADNTKYNPADLDRDKLYKIREIINMIKDRCGKVYSPRKSLRMDESLVLFKGWLSFMQYISSKRAKFGIKLYHLCIFNGILLIHCVPWNLKPGLISLENCLLITDKIPATVMQKYLKKGHHLFIDIYYTSLSLAKYLMQNGTYVT